MLTKKKWTEKHESNKAQNGYSIYKGSYLLLPTQLEDILYGDFCLTHLCIPGKILIKAYNMSRKIAIQGIKLKEHNQIKSNNLINKSVTSNKE